jgi:hypothetical protein
VQNSSPTAGLAVRVPSTACIHINGEKTPAHARRDALLVFRPATLSIKFSTSSHACASCVIYAKWWRCAMISLSGGIIAAEHLAHVVRSQRPAPRGSFSTPEPCCREKSRCWVDVCAPSTTRVLQPSRLGSRGAVSPLFLRHHNPGMSFFPSLSNLHDEHPRCISDSRQIFRLLLDIRFRS